MIFDTELSFFVSLYLLWNGWVKTDLELELDLLFALCNFLNDTEIWLITNTGLKVKWACTELVDH